MTVYAIPIWLNSQIQNVEKGKMHLNFANGLCEWTLSQLVCYTYFYANAGGKIKIELNIKVAQNMTSVIKVVIMQENRADRPIEITAEGSEFYNLGVGEVHVNKGWVAIKFQGIQKTGVYFADLRFLKVDCEVKPLYNDNYATMATLPGSFGTIKYQLPKNKNISTFFTQILVPSSPQPFENNDVKNINYFAISCKDGELGLCINEHGERYVGFYVRSAYDYYEGGEQASVFRVKVLSKHEKTSEYWIGRNVTGVIMRYGMNWQNDVAHSFKL